MTGHVFNFSSVRHYIRPSLAVLGVFGATLILANFYSQIAVYPFDDAYIHIRIAEHLAAYGVPYFNLNEPVAASSSPAWTILLACVFKLFSNHIAVIILINAFATVVGIIVYSRLLQHILLLHKQKSINMMRVGFAIIYISIMFRAAGGLMETPTALLILGIALLLFFQRVPMCFIVFGAAIFFRMEFVVFFIVFGGYAVITRRFSPSQIIKYGLLGALPFIIYNAFFFHALLPNTIYAKAKVYVVNRESVFLNLILDVLPLPLIPIELIIIVLLPLLVTLPIIILKLANNRIKSDETRILYLIGFAGILIATAYFVQAVLLFPWYTPLYIIPIMFALYGILFQSPKPIRLLGLVLTVAPLVFFLVSSVVEAYGAPGLLPDTAWNNRVHKYLDVGSRLQAQYPTATLLTSEIGGLGYAFKGYIFDAVGLASPAALRYHPMKVPDERSNGKLGTIPVAFVQEVKPDIIVSYEMFCEAFARSQAATDYNLVQEPGYTDTDMQIMGLKYPAGFNPINIYIHKGLKPFTWPVTGAP